MSVRVLGTRIFQPAQRRRLHEEVATQLRDAILHGHYQPGDKLPPERELAERFRVNRTSVREAIKLLESYGLVTVRQGHGVVVQPLVEASLDLIAPMIFRGGRIDVTLLQELQEVVSVVLYEMARIAVERVDSGHMLALRQWRDRLANDMLPREERFAAAREIMVIVADATGNRIWQMVARRLRNLLASPALRATRERLQLDPGRLVPVIDSCLKAMEEGKPKEAVARLREAFRMLGQCTAGGAMVMVEAQRKKIRGR